jgi:hypothetical protein
MTTSRRTPTTTKRTAPDLMTEPATTTTAIPTRDLIGDLKWRRAQRLRDFRAVALRIARGEAVDPAAVERVLIDASMTPDDLENAVALAKRRLALAAEVEGAEAFGVEADKALAAIAKADEALTAAQAAHEQTVGPLRGVLNAATMAKLAAVSAQERLLRDHWDVEALSRYNELNAALATPPSEDDTADRAALAVERDELRARLLQP